MFSKYRGGKNVKEGGVMKSMVYVVIAFTSLIVAGAIFAGCTSTNNENSAKLTGLSLTQNHMNFGGCYSFYLREEDSEILFNADVRFEEEPYSIILENCKVDKAYLEELQNLDEKYKISDYVTTHKKKPSVFDVSDKTVNKTTVYLSDGTDKSADTKEEHIDVLYDFFLNLAKKYQSESVYVYEQ